MRRASQMPHYNHFVALCYVWVEVIHRIKFLRYYRKASLVFNRLTPLVSRGAPGSCPSSLRSVDTGAVLRIRWASAVAGVVCPCVRSAGVLATRGNAPGRTREV